MPTQCDQIPLAIGPKSKWVRVIFWSPSTWPTAKEEKGEGWRDERVLIAFLHLAFKRALLLLQAYAFRHPQLACFIQLRFVSGIDFRDRVFKIDIKIDHKFDISCL